MSQFARYRKLLTFLLFVAVMIFTIAFSSKHQEQFSFIENGFNEVASPVSKFLSGISNGVFGIGDYVINIGTLSEDNGKLKKQVASLQMKLADYSEVKKENERVAKLLNLRHNEGYSFIAVANVIALDSSNWSRYLRIDRGSKDGVKRGDIVMTEQGLVGRISEVGNSTSKVMMITDAQSSVGGRVQRSRDIGIVQGVPSEGSLTMVDIPRTADIRRGDVIMTSGIGGVFPAGIPVGRITSVEGETSGLFRTCALKTEVDFGKLEEMMIIASDNAVLAQGE